MSRHPELFSSWLGTAMLDEHDEQTKYCLGTHLARLQLRILFQTITERLPDIHLGGDVRRLRSNFSNGIKSMPVRFSAHWEIDN